MSLFLREVSVEIVKASFAQPGFYSASVQAKFRDDREPQQQSIVQNETSRQTKSPLFEGKVMSFPVTGYRGSHVDIDLNFYKSDTSPARTASSSLFASETVPISLQLSDLSERLAHRENADTLRLRRRLFLGRVIPGLPKLRKYIGKAEIDVTLSTEQDDNDSSPDSRVSLISARSEISLAPPEPQPPALSPTTSLHTNPMENRNDVEIENDALSSFVSPVATPSTDARSRIQPLARGMRNAQLTDFSPVLEQREVTSGDSVSQQVVLPLSRPASTFEEVKPFSLPRPRFSTILPKYNSLLLKQQDQSGSFSEYKPLALPDDPAPYPANSERDREKNEKTSLDIIASLTKELEGYRTATTKMGSDILQLRARVHELEESNNQLKQDVFQYESSSGALVNVSDLDHMNRAEILRKHVQVCGRLSAEVQRSREYHRRIQQLQNELIVNNDGKTEFLKLQDAHTAQQALIQKLQERLLKAEKYKKVVKQQEKVITQLELISSPKGNSYANGHLPEVANHMAVEVYRPSNQPKAVC
ncbi:uncharacterized protein [Oscarella lobularis]|uniref:uncharacterized protein n=1 Tax=Oscarella lobularis TaxID=121494 RepID=UPI00331441A2